MKNPLRRHSHSESDPQTMAICAIVCFIFCFLTAVSVYERWPSTLPLAFASLIAGVAFKLEIAMD